jgi:2,3-diaminopropionate biosynthesis protein SbnB
MLYLNDEHLTELGTDWNAHCDVIEKAVACIVTNDYAQPVKPYLRYRDLTNRIIAMPAFIGGETNSAGIKWIASFPSNLDKGIRRANSVTILNKGETGEPYCILNTPVVSGIRTAAVTGLVLRKWLEVRQDQTEFNVGMTGFGPIGQLHLDMAFSLLGDRLKSFKIFDPRPVDEAKIPAEYRDRVEVVQSWEESFAGVDIFMTCTVSSAPYIDAEPIEGSLHLNVSLRDYKDSWVKYADVMLVDDWEEVNREKTDIEMMHINQGLNEDDVHPIQAVIKEGFFQALKPTDVVMFNPMGMAIFDIAVGEYLFNLASANSVGVSLN